MGEDLTYMWGFISGKNDGPTRPRAMRNPWAASAKKMMVPREDPREELNFSSMKDPVLNSLGEREIIPMGVLDKVAIAFPALFCVLCLVTKRVEVWTKVMVCTALLAMVKGIIGAMTTVPDSSGWETCRDAHLGKDGYQWMRQEHSFLEVFTVDTWWFLTKGHPLRYCSDMMYSGHTFFVTLYALGLYEVALIWTHMLCRSR